MTSTVTTSAAATPSAPKPTPEDAFYENLTLGLMRFLNGIPRITNVTLVKRQPCERAHVATWEQRHNVYLPDDLKRFYLSTDGFTMHWFYQYSPDCSRQVGFLTFPQLTQVSLLRENMDNLIAASKTAASTLKPSACSTRGVAAVELAVPHLNGRSKIFELSSICDLAKICLVYETPEACVPKIYLLETQHMKWNFLAETFSEYQRMSIAHLGLPYWELCFSSCGLPSWSEQLFLLLAPHLLEKGGEKRRGHSLPNNVPSPPYNSLDANVFRAKVKCTTGGGGGGGGGGGPVGSLRPSLGKGKNHC